MQQFKQSITKHKLKIFTGVIAIFIVALILGAKFIVSSINEEKDKINASLTAANKKIVDLTNDLGAAKLEAESARKEKEIISKDYEDSNEKAKAFAIQAAACEKIKKQLKIQN